MSTLLDTRRRQLSTPCLAVVGASGSGKTTLLEQLVPLLQSRGVRVAMVKHAHCGMQFDTPGKDSHRLKAAGASQVLVASAGGYALVGDALAPDTEPRLRWLLTRLDRSQCDVVLAEGFAHERGVPKLEVIRSETGKAPRCWPHDADLIAVAATSMLKDVPGIVQLNLDDAAAVADFVMAFVQQHEARVIPECA